MAKSDPMHVDIDDYNFYFNEFTRYYGLLEIPDTMRLHVYRNATTDPSVQSEPRFFSNYDVAKNYPGTNRNIYDCTLKPGTRLMDLRTLRHMLYDIIHDDVVSNCASLDAKKLTNYKRYLSSLGLCSLHEQYTIINTLYSNTSIDNFIQPFQGKCKGFPCQNFGCRLSIGNEDDELVKWMKSVLKGIDGYIAPTWRMPDKSKPHDNYFNAEICLFDPKSSLSQSEKIGNYTNIKQIHIDEIFKDDIRAFKVDIGLQTGAGSKKRPKVKRVKRAQKGGTLSHMEDYFEGGQNLEFVCKLSKLENLKSFMHHILSSFVSIFCTALDIEFETDDKQENDEKKKEKKKKVTEFIIKFLDEEKDGTFIIKPGMNKGEVEKFVEHIYESVQAPNKDQNNNTTVSLSSYSLSQIMGAIYGAVVHHGLFHIILKNCNTKFFIDRHGRHASYLLRNIMSVMRSTFALPKSFSHNDFFELVGELCTLKPEGCNIPKSGHWRILLDMMVARDMNMKTSIVNMNLMNQEYVRTRRDKVKQPGYTSTSSLTECPKFTNDQVSSKMSIVNGDEWYEVDQHSFYYAVLEKYKRKPKAGPSGSTYMWLNFCFALLGMDKSLNNHVLLLMCIIADFVPYFHSLNEVLVIFSREYFHDFPKNVDPYTIDKDPVEWLVNYLNINGANIKYPGDKPETLGDAIVTYVKELKATNCNSRTEGSIKKSNADETNAKSKPGGSIKKSKAEVKDMTKAETNAKSKPGGSIKKSKAEVKDMTKGIKAETNAKSKPGESKNNSNPKMRSGGSKK